MARNYHYGVGNEGFGFGGFGVPFLGGLAGGLLGNVLFPGYGNYGGFGGYGYGNYPFYSAPPYPYGYPYGYYPYEYYRPYY